jgi:hypothetical protein
MGADLVIGPYERVEHPLLQVGIRGSGLGGLGLQYAMHALVGAVLLRTCRRNPLMYDPQLQPPRIEAIPSVDTSNPATDVHRKTGHHDRLRLVIGSA